MYQVEQHKEQRRAISSFVPPREGWTPGENPNFTVIEHMRGDPRPHNLPTTPPSSPVQAALPITDLRTDYEEWPPASSPLGGHEKDIRNRRKRCIRDSSSDSEDGNNPFHDATGHIPPARWQPKEMKKVHFVDDLMACSKIDVTSRVRHVTTKKESRIVPADESQLYLDTVIGRTMDMGMKVNQSKTLCILTAINYYLRSSININGEEVVSGDTLKVIGIAFGRHCINRQQFLFDDNSM